MLFCPFAFMLLYPSFSAAAGSEMIFLFPLLTLSSDLLLTPNFHAIIFTPGSFCLKLQTWTIASEHNVLIPSYVLPGSYTLSCFALQMSTGQSTEKKRTWSRSWNVLPTDASALTVGQFFFLHLYVVPYISSYHALPQLQQDCWQALFPGMCFILDFMMHRPHRIL